MTKSELHAQAVGFGFDLETLRAALKFLRDFLNKLPLDATAGAECCEHEKLCRATVAAQADALEAGLKMLESCCEDE